MIDLENSIIAFDTSALLALFDYNEDSIKDILQKLGIEFSNRLHLPNYAAKEFARHRTTKIHNPISVYEHIQKKVSGNRDKDGGYIDEISSGLSDIETAFENLYRYTKNHEKHPFISSEKIESLKNAIQTYKAGISTELEKVLAEIKDRKQKIKERTDYVQSWLESKVKISREYLFNELYKLSEEAHARFDMKYPPGYKDFNEKLGVRRYADFIIWMQFIEITVQECKPAILVINDLKEDWCYQKSNDPKQIDSPREELIYEFKERTGHELCMLSLSQFLYEVNQKFNYQIKSELFEPDLLIKRDTKIIEFKVDNSQHGFGIKHFYDGRFDVSKELIICHLNSCNFINTVNFDFNLYSLRICLGYKTDNGWAIYRRGERFQLNMNLLINGQVDLSNIDLVLDISDITELGDYWIVFELESKPVSEPQRSIGTTYSHWYGLNK